MRNKGKVTLIFLGILLLLLLFLVFWYQQKAISATKEAIEYETYQKHYVFITQEDNAFWDKAYESALKEAEKNNAYLERFGADLTVDYDMNQLLRLAIQSSVDGIILEADEKEETIALINEAVDKNIPVITLGGDSSGSKRQSYVGVNFYRIGQEYGNQVTKIIGETLEEKARVFVMLKTDSESSGQYRTLMGIRETLTNQYGQDMVEVESICFDGNDNFGLEEFMRDTFLGVTDQPDFLICLDAQTTTQAYNAAVDYNRVGAIHILGYDDSNAIVSAVSRGVIDMTMSFDVEQMGSLSVEALSDYLTTGYTNGYMAVEFSIIDKELATNLLKEGEVK